MSATAFDIDISKWDVSTATEMDVMFQRAVSFKQKLCGAAWVHSKASKDHMFEGSRGSISPSVCTPSTTTTTSPSDHIIDGVFSPQSTAELKDAVEHCLTQR